MLTYMRKAASAALVAGTLTFGGCSTTQVTDFLSQVQAATATACAFVPTIDTILGVAQTLGFQPAAIAGAAITTVANAICTKVPAPASAKFLALPRRGATPANAGTVNGVTINGWRV